ncbi:MAG: hypothetical protein GY758_15930 [Fuerstiella sp.]|nr:hypothetical protein [Fuerstiella sp.]MCP4512076.1 hypothetical protein [Fuerstiella sp.]MCP4783070.1 hypothetical protein [Fuerstiella sp.]
MTRFAYLTFASLFVFSCFAGFSANRPKVMLIMVNDQGYGDMSRHGDPKGRWTRHLLKNNWRGANQVIIADLNGEQRPDIVACAEHGSVTNHEQQLKIFWKTSATAARTG